MSGDGDRLRRCTGGPRRWRWPLALAGLLAACGGEATGASGAPIARRASLISPALDVERYDVRGEFDWSQRRLYASVTVTLSAAQAPPAQVVLDSRVAALTAVRLVSGDALPFTVDAEAGTLTVELGAQASPGVAFVVDYEASTPFGSGAFGSTPLSVFGPREGDPIQARVAYTMSEPTSARAWLPSHDDPADRAFFSIELHVGAGEDLIANGERVRDETSCEGEGSVKYATSYPLPTYLMAFALGEFETEERLGPHGLPLSIWHRRGAPGDYHRLLTELDRLVGRFEALTGVPYPFEKYSLVLLPDFGGGEEHASISFQSEAFSTLPDSNGDVILSAHELAHQWFGDLVTVKTWDDLWFKEGMATLLEVEGSRPSLDRDASGLLGADAFFVRNGQAALDPARPPELKYTSGPYGRAAWVFAQVRDVVGEEAFWGAWREVLTRYRFGAAGLDEIKAAFRPALGEQGVERLQQALLAKALPALSFEPLEGGARVTLRDPEGALLAPMRFAWHRAEGAIDALELTPDVPAELVRSAPDDLLVLDPPDVHPLWRRLAVDPTNQAAYFDRIAPLLVPTSGEQRERFLAIGGAHQLSALESGALPPLQPGELGDFLRELDSDAARASAVALACERAVAEGGPWVPTVKKVLRERPFFAGLELAPATYDACSALASPDELFPVRWWLLGTGLSAPWLSGNQVEYMAKFPAHADEMLRIWSAVAEQGYSIRVRYTAAFTLALFASNPDAISEAEGPAWRARAAELVASSAVVDIAFNHISLLSSVASADAAENEAGIAALGEALRAPELAAAHPFAACTAYQLAAGDDAAWRAFVAGLEGVAVDDFTALILQDPAGICG